VNWRHFRTFVWLRWRLKVNQLKRSGIFNTVAWAIVAASCLLLAAALFVGSFVVGLIVLPGASPTVVMLVWDGLVACFLLFWTAGLITELQRSEAVSLDKFMHLPVSPAGAFLLNYLSSLVSLCLVVFLPPMVGLSLALVFAKGPAMLALWPLVAVFLLAVTALTYQFQGWLAALMVNKRRRRTVIVLVTMGFILLCQVPNLIVQNTNLFRPGKPQQPDEFEARLNEKQAELQRERAAGRITPAEYRQRLKELQDKRQAHNEESDRQTWHEVEHTARLINLAVPPGWLPLGAGAAAEGNPLPALLGTLGLGLIGTVSLWRSYRTTVRLYTGQFASGKTRHVASTPPPTGPTPARLLERELPWLSEQAAAITLGGFRSLMRAPEAKMLLLTPVLLVVIFGSMFLTRSADLPENVRPLLAFGLLMMILVSLIGLVGNQFGFDRGGFRVFVLCAAPRREILLGKNLAVAPFAFALALVALALLQVVYPMRLDRFLALIPQLLSMYLLFCVLANWLSIFAPMRVAAGSLKPANAKMIPILLQMLVVFLLPLAMLPTLLPLGVEVVLEQFGWTYGLPVCLVLSVLEFLAVVGVYRLVLTWQGRVLQSREQTILQAVTTKD
jgi:hypothetical protein